MKKLKAAYRILFQSTPSAWRVTVEYRGKKMSLYISIHTLCVEGDLIDLDSVDLECDISIHTLCVEGDPDDKQTGGNKKYFNPHPLRGG